MKKHPLLKTFLFLQICFLLTFRTVFAQTDIGVLSILEPTNPICAGSQTVQVIIRNYGATDITSATVGWEVNGVAQTDGSYSGLIPSGTNDTVTLGNFNFLSSTTYVFKVYTSAPNGGADNNTSNDTLNSAIFGVRLNGTYTIGGASPDFATVDDAIAALNSQGVCGPVVFNIRPMTDTIQAVLTPVSGASGTNTITFQSENGDSTSVNLLFPSEPAFTPTNYLIKLDGADYFTFHQLSLIRTGIEPYARIFEFTGTATYNTISNCRLIGAVNNVTNSLSALVYSTSASASNDSMNTFSNNRFENGSLGIYMNGTSNISLEGSTVITSNHFINQYSKAIQNTSQSNTLISNNIISSTSTYSGYAAIHLTSSMQSQLVTKNRISGITGTGIYLEDCSGFNTVPGIVANNFIQCTDTTGISVINGDYQDIVFNSIHMTGSNTNSAGLSMHGIMSGMVIKNNVLSNSGGGYCYTVSSAAAAGISSSDHNNLHFTGAELGRYAGSDISTLIDWVADTESDTNSISVDPGFLSATDLHATSTAMDNAGTPRANVTEDIDGTTRNATNPDIGADEFTGVTRDLGVSAILSPVNGACGSTVSEVKVIVSNNGASTETSFNVVCEITGAIGTTLNDTYSGTLLPGNTDTLTFGTSINTSAGGTFNMVCYTSFGLDVNHNNDTVSASITINAIPAAPVAVSDSTCGSGAVTLTASASDSISWYAAASGGAALDTGSSFTTPVLVATTTYYVEAKNVCPSDRVAVDAVVLPIPSVNLGNDTIIATGNSVTFDAGAGFSSYLWSPGGETTQTISANTSGCYSVVVSNNFGCENTDTVCLTVLLPTDVGILSIDSPLNGDCENANADVSVVVRNFGANDASGVIIQVNITGAVNTSFTDTITGVLASGTSTNLSLGSISTLGGGNLTIQAYTSYGPDLDNSNDTIEVTNNIVVPPAPPTGLGGSRCGAGAIVISAVASNTVEWYDAPAGGNLLFTGNTYSIPNLSATTTFYAQNGNFCNNQVRTAVVATVNPLPVVNLGPDTTAITGQTVILDAGSGFSSYNWNTSATTQTISVTTDGTYIVTVTDTNSCSNSDTIQVQFSVGINQISAISYIKIYPNPASDKVTLQLSADEKEEVTVSIQDMKGRTLLSDSRTLNRGEIRFEYDLSGLSQGIYFIRLQSSDGQIVHRLIVQ
jgi:hypothetical protein